MKTIFGPQQGTYPSLDMNERKKQIQHIKNQQLSDTILQIREEI